MPVDATRQEVIGVADPVAKVAREVEANPPQVPIAWTLANPAVVWPIIGARTLAQSESNLGALDVALGPEQLARLGEASPPPPPFPDRFITRSMVRQLVFGRSAVATP